MGMGGLGQKKSDHVNKERTETRHGFYRGLTFTGSVRSPTAAWILNINVCLIVSVLPAKFQGIPSMHVLMLTCKFKASATVAHHLTVVEK
jgi:hypothetical protein